MPAISRLYNFQEGEYAIADQVDDELNAIIVAVNLLPDKNGILQTNLNADMVDGKHVSVTGGADTIPICAAATIQTGLNADLVDGLHATDIAAAAFAPGTRLVFQQPTPPTGWTEIPKPTDYVLGWKSGQAGGTLVANSWTISGITTTVNNTVLGISHLPTHFHNMSHTHSVTDPGHDHSPIGVGAIFYTGVTDSSGTRAEAGAGTVVKNALLTGTRVTGLTVDSFSGSTQSAGGGGGHNHTATNAHSGVWRPPTAYIIVAEKN